MTLKKNKRERKGKWTVKSGRMCKKKIIKFMSQIEKTKDKKEEKIYKWQNENGIKTRKKKVEEKNKEKVWKGKQG